jgi:GNAT superfamily N-acetyltransferase
MEKTITTLNVTTDEVRLYATHYILHDGRRVSVRAIRPDDAQRLRQFFKDLSQTSIYYRFFGFKNNISDRELAAFAAPDFMLQVVLVATIGELGKERIIADGRYVVNESGQTAELALIVADDNASQGIGTLLLIHLARIARRRGILDFDVDVLASNRRATGFFLARGFKASAHLSGVGVIHASSSTADLYSDLCVWPRIRPVASIDRVRERAQEIFLARGGARGRDLEDWFAAERELR